MRIGFGYDAHGFEGGRRLILGGVALDGAGLAGHSDGDALCHSVIDALLGAAALGDLGSHFSSEDVPQGVSSLLLLERATALISRQGLHVENVDVTIVAQMVRIAPHRDEMRSNLAQAMRIPVDRVSVKATTTDGLGFTGRGEGLAAYAVALLG